MFRTRLNDDRECTGDSFGGKIQLDSAISIRFNGQSVRLEELWIEEDEVDDT